MGKGSQNTNRCFYYCYYYVYYSNIQIFPPDQHKEESVVQIYGENFILNVWHFWAKDYSAHVCYRNDYMYMYMFGMQNPYFQQTFSKGRISNTRLTTFGKKDLVTQQVPMENFQTPRYDTCFSNMHFPTHFLNSCVSHPKRPGYIMVGCEIQRCYSELVVALCLKRRGP